MNPYSLRNTVFGFLYQKILKPILFTIDPEHVHNTFTFIGRHLGSFQWTQQLIGKMFDSSHPILEQTIAGIHFKNPIGLAAGFDKDARLTQILPRVGFGFEEVGSITANPYQGNPKPRLWRHPDLQSLRVYYGLKNDGAQAIFKHLQSFSFQIPIGISIAKTNCQETAQTQTAIEDYVKTYQIFSSIGSYDTINISCPNAYGGQPFTDPEHLDHLLKAINAVRNEKPLFLKMSPDLSQDELETIAKVAQKHEVNGFICTNLTKKHSYGNGGLSGKPVSDLSLEQIRYLYNYFNGKKILIACGGIFTAKDAYSYIKAGASLLQLITGMIYKGPQVISEIKFGLEKLLKQDGFKNISEAVGKE
ncbi:quinone-dependent dihydroorotate dehydrogenase [Candidatus Uhrbacteria bacterium CG_4_9_14_3_um_filter_36_7]|uniref:Dihydroorotate dehydrogenase (quinone) n=1 Tax=Candidatus Uhrbacteria bacterium CG_4_9_14_3_um_filter_36_7 TaxID=1975033 RepID=A0A2M7XHR2_9BACT|nr:MAG: quinone-dependent dihydroorotate dehydrogenase [Candidatus Uhrbacteria bacterium CG_4_9_14_3_um_filter_36_7]